MKTHTSNTMEANAVVEGKSAGRASHVPKASGPAFDDARAASHTLQRLQRSADSSPQSLQLQRHSKMMADSLSAQTLAAQLAQPNAASSRVAQLEWRDEGGIRLKWAPKMPGIEWYFDQGMNKFVYTLDNPAEMPEKIAKHARLPLTQGQLDKLGFDRLQGANASVIPAYNPESHSGASERAKANKDFHEARAKGIELWMSLQNILAEPVTAPNVEKVDAQFDDHYYSDIDSSEFGGSLKDQALTEDQYVAWSWGYENPAHKPAPQGDEESQEDYDERMSDQGTAQYENFFDLGPEGKISAESNWRNKDMASGAKTNSVPTNITIWKQYMLAVADRERRGLGGQAETLGNLTVLTQNNLANTETINAIKVAYGANADWRGGEYTFLPGSEQFFAIIGSANCKGYVRMLAERANVLHKTIEAVAVRPTDEITSVSIDMYLKPFGT